MTHTLEHTHKQLAAIPALHALLPTAYHTRPHHTGPHTGPTSRPPMPLTLTHLLDTRPQPGRPITPEQLGTLPYLTGITAYAAQELNETPPNTHTVPLLCDWLTCHITDTLQHWPAISNGIHRLHTALHAATAHLTDPPTPTPCPTCRTPLAPTQPGVWHCPTCDTITTIQPVTIRDAARATGIPARTLYTWARRRLLAPIGDTPHRTLVDLGQVRRLATEYQTRRRPAG